MAAIAWEDVTAHASDLTTLDESAQDDVLAYVNDNVDPAKFGGETASRLKLARIFLAAHLGTVILRKGTPTAGPVTSETVGEVSRTYGLFAGATPGSGVDLSTTGWGREYLALIRRTAASRGPLVL